MAEKHDKDFGGQENTGYGHSEPPAYSGNQSYPTQQPYPGQQQYGGQPPYAGQSAYAGQPYAQPYQPYGQQSHQTSSTVVVNSQPMHQTVVARTVPDNMCLAIFACLCCFWPLGLVAIFKANESQNALGRGDIDGATKNSRDARLFSLISIGIGVVIIIVVIILAIAIPLSAAAAYSNSYTYNNGK